MMKLICSFVFTSLFVFSVCGFDARAQEIEPPVEEQIRWITKYRNSGIALSAFQSLALLGLSIVSVSIDSDTALYASVAISGVGLVGLLGSASAAIRGDRQLRKLGGDYVFGGRRGTLQQGTMRSDNTRFWTEYKRYQRAHRIGLLFSIINLGGVLMSSFGLSIDDSGEVSSLSKAGVALTVVGGAGVIGSNIVWFNSNYNLAVMERELGVGFAPVVDPRPGGGVSGVQIKSSLAF